MILNPIRGEVYSIKHYVIIRGEVYSIKHYVIKFVSDLRQVCGFLWVLQFRHKSSNWNIFEIGVKHLTSNGQMMDQTFVYVVHNIKHL